MSRNKTIILILAVLFIVGALGINWVRETPDEETPDPGETEKKRGLGLLFAPETELEPEIRIDWILYQASIYKIDEVSYSFNIKVKCSLNNLGSENDRIHIIYKVVIKNETFEGHEYTYFDRNSSSIFYIGGNVPRDIGEYKCLVTVHIMKDTEVLATRNRTVSLPTSKIGDIIPEVASRYDKHDFSLTLISWRESNIVVDGPYVGGYYTFTAKNDTKFIILFYEFLNNWTRVQTTPYFNSGEIYTDKGYIFDVWNPSLGVYSEEYNPRKSTENEVTEFIGDSGAFVDLMPEESVKGCVVFEIPKDTQPIDLILHEVPNIIILSTNPRARAVPGPLEDEG